MSQAEQGGLFDGGTAETSREARKSIQAHMGAQQKRVYMWALLQRQGFTDDEAIAALKMNPSSFRPRRGELVEVGMLKDSGQRRKTASGRSAVVWVVA